MLQEKIEIKSFCFPKKIWMIMRLTTLFTILFMMQASANSFGQRISLDEKNSSLKTIFFKIRQQSQYDFIFTGTSIKDIGKISIYARNEEVELVIERIFKNLPIEYTIVKQSVIIRRKEKSLHSITEVKNVPVLFTKDVRGRVVDSLGKPLQGATVRVSGESISTYTDAKGNFALKELQDDAMLEFSFIGYQTRKISVSENMGNIVLTQIVGDLGEIVLNAGYYSVKDREKTGNISKINSKTIENQPVTNVLSALQGRVPGLDITESGGLPGSLITVRIRGTNSIAGGNDPLYIVDGIPYSVESLGDPNVSRLLAMGSYGIMNTLNTLNSADIESIEVLKDADATAIYGSRGSNGVILITTKKGKAGKTKFDLTMNGGFNTPGRRMKMLDTKEYLKMRQDAFVEDGSQQGYEQAYDINGTWDTTRYTDWYKELVGRQASRISTQLSMSGGNELTQFLISGSFLRQEPSFPKGYNFNYKKASVHVNISHRSEDKKFAAGFTSTYSADFNNSPGDDLTRRSFNLAPNAPAVRNEDETLHWEPGFNNPFAVLNSKYDGETKSLNANLSLSYTLAKNLEIKSSFGYNEYALNEYSANPSTIYDPAWELGSQYAYVYGNTGSRDSWIIEPQLTWKKFLGKGVFDVLIGTTFQQNISKKKSDYAGNFASEELMFDPQSAVDYYLLFTSNTLYKYNAVFGRVNYNLDGKYIFNLTGRRDGSSRFGPGKQFANFGALGAAWIFSDENFLKGKGTSILSFGKLRGSYGITGNDQIGDYQFMNTYEVYGPFGGLKGMIPSHHYNPDFSWETNKKLEFALDLGFFDDKLMVSGAYYQNRSGNQLVGMPVSAITGFTTVQANLDAVVQNSGLEIEINSKNINRTRFSWSTTFNYSLPKNKLVSYPGLAASPYADNYVIGKPLSISKVFHYTGIDPATGIYTFEDVNKDGLFTYEDDRKKIVTQGINYTASLGNSFTYKNFQLDVFLQYVNKTGTNFIYTNGATGGTMIQNVSTDLLDNWTYNKINPTYQRLSAGNNLDVLYADYYMSVSDAAYSNASYLRIKNVNLSYQIPEKWLGVKGRIFIQGQNVLTFTNYKGADPENMFAIYLPPLKVWDFGLQLTF